MTRGVISGLVWGTLFSLAALWILSQLGEPVQMSKIDASAIAPPAEAPEVAPADEAPAEPAKIDQPATDPSRQQAAIQEAPEAEAPATDGEAAPAPVVAEAPDLPAGDAGEEAAPDVTVSPGRDAAPQSGGVIAAPGAPAGDTAPEVAAESAPMPAAETEMAETVSGQEAGGDTNVAAATGDAPAAPSAVAPPARPVEEAAPVVDFSTPKVVELPAAPVEEPVAETETAQPAPEPDTDIAAVAPEAETPGEPAEVVVMEPVQTFDDQAGGVRVNRLPTVAEATPTEPPADDDAGVAQDFGIEPALVAYARSFDNPGDRPMMAIVLLTGSEASLSSGDRALPVPISYALDASSDASPGLMRQARDLGQEALVLAPLAANARPEDVEQILPGYIARLPETVAVIDTDAAAFQTNRQVASQVASVLAETGHGMITYSRGLNAALQVAEREAVPAGVVFRDLDGSGQDRAAIKRFLDQAAFRAGQQSGVILVGHDRPDTVAAILEWSLGNRAQTVALAPVSAVLSAQ